MMPDKKRIVIVGAGFGGINAAKALKAVDAEVILLDRTNHHLFQPLLYQVATAGLTSADIAAPIRSIVRNHRNTTTLLRTVVGIDPVAKVLKTDGEDFTYDYLILATGARHSYFAHAEWEPLAPGLKSISDAIHLRHRILNAFELAEEEKDPLKQKALLTFVIVGAGPTGVELAGAIAELAHQVLKDEFRRITLSQTRVLLIEAGDRPLSNFHPSLSEYTLHTLKAMGVEVQVNTKVLDIQPGLVTTDKATFETSNVVWAAGVMASPVARWLGITPDRAGRVPVSEDCSVPGMPDIFVIGDTMTLNGPDGKPLPGVSPVAMQQGTYVGKLIKSQLEGLQKPAAFKYWNKGNMATIGRKSAVAEVGNMRVTGFFAWVIWLVIHMWYLIGFDTKVSVILQWAWAYFTLKRRSRILYPGESRGMP